MNLTDLLNNKKNFVFLGETGCGKSEIVLNIARMLAEKGEREVHLYDMDQTKPLFRSRDLKQTMESYGVNVHYKPQLLDTPVLVNGVIPRLSSDDCYTLLDVGGNENAARMIGCFAEYLNNEESEALYILNPYRPWSSTVEHIDRTMTTILNACHIERLSFLANANLGSETTVDEYNEGNRKIEGMLGGHINIAGSFVREGIYPEVKEGSRYITYPLHLYLKYPWIDYAI